ncbi:MAG: ABC transporter ATP-binding protein [Propionibacteriaceae bacterium]|nr:ABC transporter ATP-binding protein [Propionibacteriaceae bacterium]
MLDVSNLTCEITMTRTPIEIVQDMDLQVRGGEAVAITGRSGTGKTTILRTIAGLHPMRAGSVAISGEAMAGSEERRAAVRLKHIGFVYQDCRLLEQLDAVRNVALAARIQGHGRRRAVELAEEMLGRVGLGHRLHHRPRQLSGGECQRVGIARALIGEPSLILADEPTGSLGREYRDEILELLRDVAGESTAILVVTHDADISRWCDRTYRLGQGKLTPSV